MTHRKDSLENLEVIDVYCVNYQRRKCQRKGGLIQQLSSSLD